MGWTFYHATHLSWTHVNRKLEMDHRYKPNKVIKSALVENTYYAAIEDYETHEVHAVICLTGEHLNKKMNFFYLAFDEKDNPPYYACPKSILKRLAPTDNVQANIWRQKCMEYKRIRISKLNFGDRIIWTDFKGVDHILEKHAPKDPIVKWYWWDAEREKVVLRTFVNSKNIRPVGQGKLQDP